MACRHTSDDPNCSSHPDRVHERSVARLNADNKRRADLEAEKLWISRGLTPDVSNFEIKEIEEVGRFLVLKVEYPNCSKCAHQGMKVMVIEATLKSAVMWKIIDPHFGKTENVIRDRKMAPPPIARFPANPVGWRDAIEYAQIKCERATI